MLNISVKTVQLWADHGILNAWKTPGGHRRITLKSIEDLLQEQRFILKRGVVGERAGPNPLRVLVVEDEMRMRRLYADVMSQWGLPLQVTMARDGAEALLRIGQSPFDVLITDVNMPGVDGFRLIAALRASEVCKGLRIVVVTGLTAPQIRACGGLPTDIPFISKPIHFNSLRFIIENNLVDRTE